MEYNSLSVFPKTFFHRCEQKLVFAVVSMGMCPLPMPDETAQSATPSGNRIFFITYINHSGAGHVAQWVESPPSMHEALDFDPQ